MNNDNNMLGNDGTLKSIPPEIPPPDQEENNSLKKTEEFLRDKYLHCRSNLSPREEKKVREEEKVKAFEEDFSEMKDKPSITKIIDATLRHPGRAAYEIANGNRTKTSFILLLIIIVSMLGYGLIIGSFSGGLQLIAVPLKLSLGLLFSMLMCFPSLYILVAMDGGKQSVGELFGFLLLCISLSCILLIGFAPVTWIFSQSTNAAGFMGFLHLIFWATGFHFGLKLLARSLTVLNKRKIALLKLWSIIFTVVILQMTTTLRPIVSKYEPSKIGEKRFFIGHWAETVFGTPHRRR